MAVSLDDTFGKGLGGYTFDTEPLETTSTPAPSSAVGLTWDRFVGGALAIGDSALDLLGRYTDLTKDQGQPTQRDTSNPKAVPNAVHGSQQTPVVNWNTVLMIGFVALLAIVAVVLLFKLI